MSVIDEIAAERRRQIEVEGWTPEHDDEHAYGVLAAAAACYAAHSGRSSTLRIMRRHMPPFGWPWNAKWWKPLSPRRDLIKAGALIVAEIERMDRAASKERRELLEG